MAGGGGTKLLSNYFGEEPLEVIDTKRSGRIPVILFCLHRTRAVEKTAKIAILAASLFLTLSFLCVAHESIANNILQGRDGWELVITIAKESLTQLSVKNLFCQCISPENSRHLAGLQKIAKMNM